jgi:uncharacterized protein YraI
VRVLLTAIIIAFNVCGGLATFVDPAEAAVTRTTSHLNMRFGPGADFRRVTTIPPGQTINVLGCTGNWCAVIWRRHQGYVNARYLSTHKTLIVSPLYAFGQ